MSNKLSISDLNLKNERVLMRVDFNVPLDNNGRITDDTRIEAALPTIKYAIEHGAKLILMSHLGRPKGQQKPELSLKPCAERLSEKLGIPVKLAPDSVGSEVNSMADNLQAGEVLLLENLRFHKGEEKPESEPDFTEKLAELGDIYINDAFGTAHRPHASTTLIAKYFPGKAAAGFLMEKEIKYLGDHLLNPKRPFYTIIGGAKVSTKLGVLRALIKKADAILVGGGMAYTFFKAQGIQIGSSICEEDLLVQAREIMRDCKEQGVQLILPIDNVVVDNIQDPHKTIRIVETGKGIPPGFQGVDIGPRSIDLFKRTLKGAATIFWNGPLGVFEYPEFAKGTQAIALAVTDSHAITIVGGGDSIAALQAEGLANKIKHISTGGGASLEYIEFGKLPGIEALTDKEAISSSSI